MFLKRLENDGVVIKIHPNEKNILNYYSKCEQIDAVQALEKAIC